VRRILKAMLLAWVGKKLYQRFVSDDSEPSGTRRRGKSR
jgi:hypothetical protein